MAGGRPVQPRDLVRLGAVVCVPDEKKRDDVIAGRGCRWAERARQHAGGCGGQCEVLEKAAACWAW